jgi:hypothetical protein
MPGFDGRGVDRCSDTYKNETGIRFVGYGIIGL